MSTAAARFGPRIGGWRSRQPSPEPTPSIADLMASLYRVRLGSRESWTTCDVLAFDANQAAQFARFRLDVAPDTVAEARHIGSPAEHYDMTRGVLIAETGEESEERSARYAQMTREETH